MKEVRDGNKYTNSHWITLSKTKQILLVDFDHTITKKCLACKDGLKGDGVQEGAKETLTKLSKDFQIWIYTGNYGLLEEREITVKRTVKTIREFLEKNNIPFDKILQTKPPGMFIIDDRAIHHEGWVGEKSTLKKMEERMKTI